MIPESALDELKRQTSCADIAWRWSGRVNLAWRDKKSKVVGQCPICKASENKRTAFEAKFESWVCAVCPDGGDVIELVMKVEGLSFLDAYDWLGGKRDIVVDPEREKELEAERQAQKDKRDRESQNYRDRERNTCWNIWTHADKHLAGSPVEAYLRLRGICELPAQPRLRCVRDMPFWIERDDKLTVIHRGPAMVAPIARPNGHFGGIHLTWIDLARILDPENGEVLNAKKSRGSMKGGCSDVARPDNARRMVIGEGFEKVLAIWLAETKTGRDTSSTIYRVSLNLGNLGGKALKESAIKRKPGPVPDLAEPGIPVPDTVEEVFILGDSGSDPLLTKCAIARAAKRWERPGRLIRVAWSPDGQDFDDLLRAA
jgi:hypothetical protein